MTSLDGNLAYPGGGSAAVLAGRAEMCPSLVKIEFQAKPGANVILSGGARTQTQDFPVVLG